MDKIVDMIYLRKIQFELAMRKAAKPVQRTGAKRTLAQRGLVFLLKI